MMTMTRTKPCSNNMNYLFKLLFVGATLLALSTTSSVAATSPHHKPLLHPTTTIQSLHNNNNNNNGNMIGTVQKSTEWNAWGQPILLNIRGGAFDSDNQESDEEDSDEEDDDDAYLLGDGNDDNDDDDDFLAESEFAEDNTLERMLDAFIKTPPLTKAYLTCSFAATLYGYVCNKNQFPAFLSLEWKPVLRKLQLWRPFTAFFNFGPFGLSYIMTAHFVWTYMATLERLSHKAPYDFWIMMAFGQIAMVIGYPLLKLSPRFLGHNLSTFLVYIWARYHEGLEVNLFELFNTRAELLPWFFLAQTFLLEGEPPILDFLGIVFGHVYHYCKTVGILRAPPAVRQWYHDGQSALAVYMRKQYKQISSDFEMI